jgi:hypothetical protein
MGISTFEYKLLMIDENKSTPINHTIKTHIPVPDYLDYRRGYVVRYFIQRINDDNATIYEVNSKNFEKYLTDPFWNAVSLDWRILGSMEEIEKSNKASVTLASKKMYAILFYLPNYLQFSGF